ncbi:MAG TPA: polyprenol phosphomannose-dependent alpha 1,6 mannosyltransferase MptB [Actinoplanes sp.]|nr:polyprenol phosphomannose-dependent alpha 1,6 mannosyltransferase MptB [Actinoplanes sp.]
MARPAVIRYAGLAGSVLLAVAAYLGGARSPWQPTMTPRTVLAGENGLLLPLSWLIGTVLLVGAWWAGRTVVPSARWAYVTAALWAVPLLPMLPLGSYDVYSYACQGYLLAAGQDPYAAGAAVLGCPWLEAVSPTWRDAPAPYGPVFLVLAAAAAQLGGTLAGTVAVLRVIAVLGVVLIAVAVPVLARHCDVPPARAVWLALACPLVTIHLISGAHNDAVMVGLLVAALAVATRPPTAATLAAAGVLLGLAVGVKVTAVVVLPFVVLMAVPPRAPLRGLLRPAAVVTGSAVAALAAVSATTRLGFGWVTNLSDSGASVQWTSPPTAIGLTAGLVGRVFGAQWDPVPVTRVLGIAALVAVLAVLWWQARAADPLLYAGLALAATVALAPVFHPWYATWPLAVLAATLHRDTRWLVVPCAVAAALCLPDGYNLALATRMQGAVVVTALVLFVLVRGVRRA